MLSTEAVSTPGAAPGLPPPGLASVMFPTMGWGCSENGGFSPTEDSARPTWGSGLWQPPSTAHWRWPSGGAGAAAPAALPAAAAAYAWPIAPGTLPVASPPPRTPGKMQPASGTKI